VRARTAIDCLLDLHSCTIQPHATRAAQSVLKQMHQPRAEQGLDLRVPLVYLSVVEVQAAGPWAGGLGGRRPTKVGLAGPTQPPTTPPESAAPVMGGTWQPQRKLGARGML
jgi:hypothetical protein